MSEHPINSRPAIVELDLNPDIPLWPTAPERPQRVTPPGPCRVSIDTALMERYVSGAQLGGDCTPVMMLAEDSRAAYFVIDAAGALSMFLERPGRHRGWQYAPVDGLPAGARVLAIAPFPHRTMWLAIGLRLANGRHRVMVVEELGHERPPRWVDWGEMPGVEALSVIDFGAHQRLALVGAGAVHLAAAPGAWTWLGEAGAQARGLGGEWLFTNQGFQPAVTWLEPDRGARRSVTLDGSLMQEHIGDVSAWRTVHSNVPGGEVLIARGTAISLRSTGAERRLGTVPKGGAISALFSVRTRRGLEHLALNDVGLWLFDGSMYQTWHCIASDVTHVACARDQTRADHLQIAVTDDEHLAVLVRDGKSSLFRRAELALPHPTEAHQVLTCTTRIRVLDGHGAPLAQVPFELVVESGCYLEVNGHAGFHAAGAKIATQTDAEGALCVVKHLHGLAMPLMRFSSPGLRHGFAVDPTSHVGHALEKANRDDLDTVKLGAHGGPSRPLVEVPRGHGKAASKAVARVAEHMRAIAGAQRIAQAVAEPPGAVPEDWHRLGVCRWDPAGPLTASVPAFPFGRQAWSLRIDDEGARFTEHDPDQGHFAELDRAAQLEPASLLDQIGAFLEHLVNGAGALFEVFMEGIEDGLRIVFNGVRAFVVKTLEGLAHVAGALLKSMLGIDLERIVQWLGVLFDWDDIADTHQALIDQALASLTQMKDGVANLSRWATEHLDGVKDKFAALTLPADLAQMKLSDLLGGAGSAVATGLAAATAGPSLQHHPAVHWVASAVAHGPTPEKQSPGSTPDEWTAAGETLAALKTHFDALAADLKTHFETFKRVMGSNDPSLGDLLALLKAALGGAIDLTEVIVEAVSGVAQIVLAAIIDLVRRPIRLPLLTFIWKDLLRQKGELTLLGAALLPAAVPLTVLHKVATGRAPFPARGLANLDDKAQREWFGVWMGGLAAQLCQTFVIIWEGFFLEKLCYSFLLVSLLKICIAIFWFPTLNPEPFRGQRTTTWAIWILFAVQTGIGCVVDVFTAGQGTEIDHIVTIVAAGITIFLELQHFNWREPSNKPWQEHEAKMRFAQAVFSPAGDFAKLLAGLFFEFGEVVAAAVAWGAMAILRAAELSMGWARVGLVIDDWNKRQPKQAGGPDGLLDAPAPA